MGTDTTRLSDAMAFLEGIQAKGETPCTLCGDPVFVAALPGNAFRFRSGYACDPAGLKSYKRLGDVGADIWTNDTGDGTGTYKAMATWDTTLHCLVLTGDLKETERKLKR